MDKSIKNDVAHFVRKCTKCNLSKSKNTVVAPLRLTSFSDTTFEKIFIDIVGPLAESYEGHKHILTAKDDLSKYIFAIPIEDQTSESFAKALVEEVIMRVGCPRMIVADNAANSNSDLMKRLYKLLGVKK